MEREKKEMAQLKVLKEEWDAVQTQFSTMATDVAVAFAKMIQELRDNGIGGVNYV
ncbi:hypothetical protein [Bacillus sp. 491mf]|uniref:hypothetical protein n=1 Tax=Bacillus sp. 491mf TaxID=1761755 RepID=UPI001C4338DC|nr:hypothetical protein [Bacillus sp. 491mf]